MAPLMTLIVSAKLIFTSNLVPYWDHKLRYWLQILFLSVKSKTFLRETLTKLCNSKGEKLTSFCNEKLTELGLIFRINNSLCNISLEFPEKVDIAGHPIEMASASEFGKPS